MEHLHAQGRGTREEAGGTYEPRDSRVVTGVPQQGEPFCAEDVATRTTVFCPQAQE